MRRFLVLALFLLPGSLFADSVDAYKKRAAGLSEQIISIELSSTAEQSGVFSMMKGSSKSPTKLAVLLPGGNAVIRAQVSENIITHARLSGNFLIRSRRHLVDEDIATLIVDCRTDLGDECPDAYQASSEREADVYRLVKEVLRRFPSIQDIWLIGTSRGTVSSGFMAHHGKDHYAGAIHTATISEHFKKGAPDQMRNLDYSSIKIPQAFIHHKKDPCYLTTYSAIERIAKKFSVPLITVSGEKNLSGPECHGFTQHGFRGREKVVMKKIRQIILLGSLRSELIE
jgi:hypothetical protein